MKRLKQILTPQSIVVAAVLAVAVYIGLGAAIDNFHRELTQTYQVSATDWERLTGILYQRVAPVLVSAIEIAYFLALLVFPAQESDRVILQRYARQRLADPFLSDEEQLIWSQVLGVHHD